MIRKVFLILLQINCLPPPTYSSLVRPHMRGTPGFHCRQKTRWHMKMWTSKGRRTGPNDHNLLVFCTECKPTFSRCHLSANHFSFQEILDKKTIPVHSLVYFRCAWRWRVFLWWASFSTSKKRLTEKKNTFASDDPNYMTVNFPTCMLHSLNRNYCNTVYSVFSLNSSNPLIHMITLITVNKMFSTIFVCLF